MKSCDICSILSNPDQTELDAQVSGNSTWVANLNLTDQSLLGTTSITSRTHSRHLSELVPGEWLELKSILDPLERAVIDAFGASAVNLLFLTEPAYRPTGPTTHSRVEFTPRYWAPIEVNGLVFSDPNPGDRLPSGRQPRPVDTETARVIVDMITEKL